MTYAKYKVQSGDTTWGLARKYKCSQAQLCYINKITIPEYIQVGQVLKIPSEKQIKRWNIMQSIFEFVGVIVTDIIIVLIGIWCFKFLGGIITYIKEYEPPVCHYEYVDYSGSAGIAQECTSWFGILYCGDNDEAFKVNGVKKVCQ